MWFVQAKIHWEYAPVEAGHSYGEDIKENTWRHHSVELYTSVSEQKPSQVYNNLSLRPKPEGASSDFSYYRNCVEITFAIKEE